MKNQRLQQFAASLLVVLSLFASSVAACSCTHHQEKVQADALSCHQHSAENQSVALNQTAETSAASDATEDCVCVQSAPRVFAKSEIVKIEKQASGISPNIKISVTLTASISVVTTSDYSKPLYLSDSFYNIKSPRAPPIL